MNLYLKGLNYCYIAYKNDEYQFIKYITDTKKEMSKSLNITISGLSRLMSRRVFSKLKIERVQIADYCFVVYKNGLTNIDDIVFITRSFDIIAKKFKINKTCFSKLLKLFFCPNSYKLRVDCKKQFFEINDKYCIGLLDLFDLDSLDLQKVNCKLLNIKFEDVNTNLYSKQNLKK